MGHLHSFVERWRHELSGGNNNSARVNFLVLSFKLVYYCVLQTPLRTHRSRMSFEDVVAPLRDRPIDYPSLQAHNIITAIYSNVHQVTFKESHHPDPPSRHEIHEMSTNELSKYFHYDIESVYNLHSNVKYFSLDQEHHATSVKDISDRKLLHCPNPQTQQATGSSPEVGDIFMATSHGDDIHSSVSTANVHRNLVNFMNSPHVRQNKGFLMLRRVVQIDNTPPADIISDARGLEDVDTDACRTVHTEDIIPFDLFHDFKINTAVDRRTQEIFYAKPQEHVDLGEYVMNVDSPIHACSDSQYFNSGAQLDTAFDDVIDGYSGYGKLQYLYCTGLLAAFGGCQTTQLCSVYNLAAPGSFNYNYNPSTRSAVHSPIHFDDYGVYGLSCNNCYAFMGVCCHSIVVII